MGRGGGGAAAKDNGEPIIRHHDRGCVLKTATGNVEALPLTRFKVPLSLHHAVNLHNGEEKGLSKKTTAPSLLLCERLCAYHAQLTAG